MTTAPASPPPAAPQQPAPQVPWPYPPYGYPPYPQLAPRPPDNRGPLGLINWSAGKVVAVVLVLLILFGGYILLMVLLSTSPSSADVVTDYDQNVTIAEGGHFRYPLPSSAWQTTHVFLNITSSGGKRFDVYIMDSNQYDNAYTNLTTRAFSATERFENRTAVVEQVELPQDGRTYFLVVDNAANELTPDGAVPNGPISIRLWTQVVQRSSVQ